MTQLSELSSQVAALIETIGASVVHVRGRRRRGSTGLVWDADHVLASHHALRRDTVPVTLPDGSEREGTVVGRDRATDTALVRLEGHGLPIPSWGSEARTGHLVLVVGRPHGRTRATLGMVGGVGGSWETALGATLDAYIDIDGTLPRGFTGGPLVATDGTVLGLNTSIVVQGGVTIPASNLPAVVERALKRGSAGKRGYLGVTVQPVRGGGLLVAEVEEGGPAAAAGVLIGDVLKSIAGEDLTSHAVLLRALGDAGVGSEIQLGLTRGGKAVEVTLTLGERVPRA